MGRPLSRTLPPIPYVKQFLALNCQIPLYVYVEDETQALGDVALMMIDTSLTALLRARLRPKDLRSKKHFGLGEAAETAAEEDELWPDVARKVGKRWATISGPIEANYSWAGKLMWKISDVAQDASYLFLVLDVATKYLYDSLHLLAKDPRNHCAHANATGYASNQIQRATPGGNIGPILAFDTFHVHPPNFTVSDRIFLGPGYHNVFWGVTAHNLDTTFPADVGLQIIHPVTLQVLADSGVTTLAPNGITDLVISYGRYPEGELILWTYQRGLDFVNFANVDVMSTYAGPVENVPQPVDPNRAKPDYPKGPSNARTKKKRNRKPYKLKFAKYEA